MSYHPDTEILLRTGWTPAGKVERDDEAAVVDPTNRQLRYLSVTSVETRQVSECLVVNATRHGPAFAVTGDHVMAITSRGRPGGPLRSCRADALPRSALIPQTVEWIGECPRGRKFHSRASGIGQTFDATTWAEFLTWYCWHGVTDHRYLVRINAETDPRRSRVAELFSRIEGAHCSPPRGLTLNSKAVVQHLDLHCGADRRLPGYVRDYDVEHSQAMLDVVFDGGRTFTSTRFGLVGDVAELALRAGWRPTVTRIRQAPPRHWPGAGMVEVARLKIARRASDSEITGVAAEPYSGPVYTVSAGGPLVTRIDGVVAVA